jgi:hypothetical protein
MTTIYRTEHCLVLFSTEGTWGTRAQPSKRFGIHEAVTVPDMENEWYPFFGVASGRSRDTILRGRLAFRGGVPDIRLQSTTDLKALLALMLGRVSGTTVLEGVGASDERVPSMTLQVAMRDTSGNYSFIREFYGGKVGRASLKAAEGEELRLSLDDVIFKDMAHNRSGVSKYNAAVMLGTDPGASGAPRFLFAGATIQAAGVTLAKVKRFNLTVDNQLEAKYYLSKAAGDPTNLTQVPNDIVEGRRAYTLEVELDVSNMADLELFDLLVNQGAAAPGGATIGFSVVMQFQLSEGTSGTLTIVCSTGATSAHPGAVIRSGKINVPPPPTGYFPSVWAMDVDHVIITTPI